jgi:hypothetical protein
MSGDETTGLPIERFPDRDFNDLDDLLDMVAILVGVSVMPSRNAQLRLILAELATLKAQWQAEALKEAGAAKGLGAVSAITTFPALDALPLGAVIRNTTPMGYGAPGTLMFVGESAGRRRYFLTNGDSRSAQQVMEWTPITVEWMPVVRAAALLAPTTTTPLAYEDTADEA